MVPNQGHQQKLLIRIFRFLLFDETESQMKNVEEIRLKGEVKENEILENELVDM